MVEITTKTEWKYNWETKIVINHAHLFFLKKIMTPITQVVLVISYV